MCLQMPVTRLMTYQRVLNLKGANTVAVLILQSVILIQSDTHESSAQHINALFVLLPPKIWGLLSMTKTFANCHYFYTSKQTRDS